MQPLLNTLWLRQKIMRSNLLLKMGFRTLCACALVLSGCKGGTKLDVVTLINATASITSTPIDVMQQVERTALSVVADNNPTNLLSNGSFENGKSDWSECSNTGTAVKIVGDAYDGASALEFNGGDCFYQSIETTPGTDLILSCYAKVSDEYRWTGLGIGFSDVGWKTLSQAPATVITNSTYARYNVRATAPDNTQYVSIWFYTETPALLDNCTLVTANNNIEPPIISFNASNLLDNGTFTQMTNTMPSYWVDYCGGIASASQSDETNREPELLLGSGACVSQSLDASKLAVIQDKEVELTCEYEYSDNNYAELIFNLNGEDKVARVIQGESSVTHKFTAPNDLSTGFISIYSEGKPDSLRVKSCKLAVETTVDPNPEVTSLLANGSFDEADANNKPQQWSNGCRGRWVLVDSPLSAAALELSSDAGFPCLSQVLSSTAVTQLNNRAFEFSCDVLKPAGTFASMRIHFNNRSQRIDSVDIPDSDNYERFTLRGEAGSIENATVFISGGAVNGSPAKFDNCTLTIDETTTTEVGEYSGGGKVDIRNNLEGSERWLMGGQSFENQITVINTGQVPLTNLTISNDTLTGCSFSYTALAVGEMKTETCIAPQGIAPDTTLLTHTATVTATDPDGQTLTDSDSSSFQSEPTQMPSQLIVVTPSSYGADAGDDITFIVEAANNGNFEGGLAGISTTLADCNRVFATPLTPGQFERYTCTATNVQPPFSLLFTAMGTPFTYDQASVRIVPSGTEDINISFAREGDEVYEVNYGNPTYEITVRNNGAEELTNAQITTGTPACDKTIASLPPNGIETYDCELPVIKRQINYNTASVVATTPSGTQITDEDKVTFYNRGEAKLDIQLGPRYGTITGQPGEQVDVTLSLANRGHLPVSQIDSITISGQSAANVDISTCVSVAASIPLGALELDPGQVVTYDCSITLPGNFTNESRSITSSVVYAIGPQALIPRPITARDYLYVYEETPLNPPVEATVFSYTPPVTDSSALPNPSINPSRASGLLSNGDFEMLDANNIPVGWASACDGNTYSSIETQDGKGARVTSDTCATFQLDGNALAQLSGNAYKLSCEVSDWYGYSSISMSLNGAYSVEKVRSGQYALEIIGDAPANLTEGLISIYSFGAATFDNCHLTIVGPSNSNASIVVSNQAHGIDTYENYGSMDFGVAVTNSGDVELSDIELSSDKLDCDTNFQSLAVGESKTVLCESTTEITINDQFFNHRVTATALTPSGTIVRDADSAATSASIYAATTYIKVTSDFVDIDDLAPVTAGTNVVLDVQVANNTTTMLGLITSTIPSCNKIFNPAIPFGGVVSYQCTVENIQQDTVVEIAPAIRPISGFVVRPAEHTVVVE